MFFFSNCDSGEGIGLGNVAEKWTVKVSSPIIMEVEMANYLDSNGKWKV